MVVRLLWTALEGQEALMTLSGFTSVVSRRMFVAVALGASLFVGSNAWAQAAPAEQDAFKFSTDSAVMIYSIKPDKAAGFEALWSALRTKALASEKPDLKALGESLKIFKVQSAVPEGQGQMYFFFADPAAKISYQIVPLLYNSGLFTRAEADEAFNKVGADAFMIINAIPATKVP